MDSRVQAVIEEQNRMAAARGNFDSHWQEVAERVDPSSAYFTSQRTSGSKQTEKLFDSTASISLGRATAAFESMVTPRTQKWHGMTSGDPSLANDQPTRIYLEAMRDLLFRIRYSTRANFANQNSVFIRSFLCYGNAILYIDDDPGVSLRYKACHLAECFFSENHTGRVDRVHRKFKLTARQILTKFPNAQIPFRIVEAAEKSPATEFDVLHCVYPNPEVDRRGPHAQRLPIVGTYVLPDEGVFLDVAGFSSMPYLVARYRVTAREVYGRGPAMDCLPAIKTVNEMQKTNLRAGQRLADPPLLTYRDGFASPFSLRSGAINSGALDEQGRPLVRPLETAASLPVALEMQDAERNVIKDAFFVTLFQILEENPVKTATQVLEEVQQRGVLMSPPVGQLQTEAYGPMIEREVDLLSQAEGGTFLARRLGDMPQTLLDRGGAYEIEYDAPINKAQKAEEGIAILRTIEVATPLAQIDPGVLKVIKVRETLRALARINGMPSHLVATEEEIEAQEEGEQVQADLSQVLAGAPVVAGAARDLAQAEALSNPGGAQRVPA
jgi:hypothetical protein